MKICLCKIKYEILCEIAEENSKRLTHSTIFIFHRKSESLRIRAYTCYLAIKLFNVVLINPTLGLTRRQDMDKVYLWQIVAFVNSRVAEKVCDKI